MESSAPPDPEEEMKKDVVKYFSFQPKRDSASDVRNALLVVAALVATVTFDKGTDVPGTIENNTAKMVFVVANTIAFSASVSVIEFLTQGFPLKRETQISLFSVCFAYGAGVGTHVKGNRELVLLYGSIIAPLLISKLSNYLKK
ncbi:hypothetical protein POM88_000624 [Heracleum sosnowskyi]|uniref:PGG domain-containing protein n=1 Tax=Heracleum sosnowskyi TaxID=360622 RepID=A0AAD8JBH6_9APIA|nr:hypothetical protein POM88_000624 [Heracleum sosnowskyi]